MGSAKFVAHDGSGVDVCGGIAIALGVTPGIIVGVEVDGRRVWVEVDLTAREGAVAVEHACKKITNSKAKI